MPEGFIDLRPGSRADNIHDSFWPSFTDVMMVVVMIFIMASLILVVKNWDLISELRATIAAERRAEEMARTASATNLTLSEQLAQVQHQLSELRMELMRLKEESTRKSALINERDQQILATRNELRVATEQVATAERKRGELTDELSQTRARQETELAKFESLRREHEALEASFKSQVANLATLQYQHEDSQVLYVALQGEYDDLKVKYDKLVRPARTPKGKHVVEVHYEKRGKHTRIKYKEPDDGQYTASSRKELDQHLSMLKDDYAGQLYIKIIIPSNSGLSYNEAWRFTADVLAKYDYYHQ